MENKEMKVRIFDLDKGLTEYENIKTIRLVSDTYNLLIMKDYMPIIGEIEGSISIKGQDIDLSFDPVKAYYVSEDNVFNLMLNEEMSIQV